MIDRPRSATPGETTLLRKAIGRWRGYRLPNGIPMRKRLKPSDFNQHQLAIGTKVELEHTRDPALALEIAMAHLYEDTAYYAKLERMGL